jgi:hypothetical protein
MSVMDTRARVSIEGRDYEGVVKHGIGKSGDEGNWWFGVEFDDGQFGEHFECELMCELTTDSLREHQ